MSKRTERVSTLTGLAALLGSLCFTLTVAFLSYQYYLQWVEERKVDQRFVVQGLIQTGYEKEPLPTEALIELMGLSHDKPLNLYAASEKRLANRLLTTPFFKEVKVGKIYPNVLYVDYVAKKPFAYLKDYSNTLIAEDGTLLPFKPFFPPKNFPSIYLGPLLAVAPGERIFGHTVNAKTMELVKSFTTRAQDYFEKRGFRLEFIDFQNAERGSQELSEIVLLVEGKRRFAKDREVDLKVLIRFAVESYSEAMGAFERILKNEDKRIRSVAGRSKEIGSWHMMLDLRTKGIALVSP